MPPVQSVTCLPGLYPGAAWYAHVLDLPHRSSHPTPTLSSRPKARFLRRSGETPAFCLRLHDCSCAKDACGPLPPGESPALAFLSVIPVGNLLLFSHHATPPPWQGPEGQGFNPANNTRTKAPYLAAAGRSEGAAATTELPSLTEVKQPDHRRYLHSAAQRNASM